jgi:N-acetylglucosaminyl-diphospho-decaprenol L-rhamnosyltransferase
MTSSAEGSDGTEHSELAVVVVNYNSGDEVRGCVRSIFESTGDVGLDVVIVDNRSVDGSAEAAVAAFPQTRLIRNDRNRGFPAAANVGMRQTDSEFVFLINPDAEIIAGTLAGFLKVARDHPRAGAIGALVRDPDGSIYPSARKVPTLTEGLVHTVLGYVRPDNRWTRAYKLLDWDRRSERQVDWVSGSSMLIRRAALDELGVFDERFFMYVEDMDLCTRLRRAGWEVWFSPELEIEHVGGTATAGSRRMTFEHSKSIYAYFVKHRSTGWRAALRPFVWAALMARAALVSWRRGER